MFSGTYLHSAVWPLSSLTVHLQAKANVVASTCMTFII